MKKETGRGMIILLIVTAMLVGCAGGPVMMTSKDLPSLKGKWVGRTVFGSGEDTKTELEIYGETVPIEGKITFQTLPRGIWDQIPPGIKGGTAGQGAEVPFKKGRLSDKGAFVLASGENKLTLNLYSDGGKLRLVGDILLDTVRMERPYIHGEVSLTKE